MRSLELSVADPDSVGRFKGTAYRVYGQGGGAVVLVHGVGMQQAIWAPQIAALSERHRVVTYDMLGHGESQDPPEGVRLVDYACQLADLLDHLRIDAAAVVGHSMGALVALEFALQYPARASHVVALNATFNRTPEQRAAVLGRADALECTGVSATIDSTIERWFGNPVPEDLRASAALINRFMRQVHPVGYARSYRLFASSDAAHVDRLQHLRMPVLFMTGELDPNSTPAMSEAMASRVARAELVIINGARHKMPLTRPAEVNERLLRFLNTKP